MNQYEVFIRDENGNRIVQVESFTSLSFIRRFNAVGSWALVSTPENLAGLTKKGGIEINRNGKPHFSGVARRFQDKDGLTLTGGGSDDLKMISGQLAWPVPGGAPFSSDYDVRSGIAETIIKQFVNFNIGPGAIPARRVAGLTVEADYGRGGVDTGRARFDNLFSLISSLASRNGLGFTVENLMFKVYVPQDKTGTIIFSKELGTLGEYTFITEAGDANYLICGGSGEGSARTLVEGSDAASVLQWGRAEAFLDKGNTSSVEELNAAISEELLKKSEKVSLVFTPVITERMRPVDDYDVGDWVKSVINGESVNQQVREIKTTLDGSGGEKIDLAIGTDGASSDMSTMSGIYSRIRGIDQRITVWERR